MVASAPPKAHRQLLTAQSALLGVLVIWVAYTILYTLHPGDALSAILEFAPGVLAVGVLGAAGFSARDCFLQRGPLSRTGLLWLAATLIFMPLMWLTGQWTGWAGAAALIYAVASGISQELFFRAALLPVLLDVLKGRPWLAISLQARLFAAWHLPKAAMTAPLGGAIAVGMVTFVSGLLWAKQVQRDRTVFWMMGFHSILLIVNTFFTW